MVPDGYDLFKYGWPPSKGWFEGESKEHPLYMTFVQKALEAGFVVTSPGFRDSENAYFGFFLMGCEAKCKS